MSHERIRLGRIREEAQPGVVLQAQVVVGVDDGVGVARQQTPHPGRAHDEVPHQETGDAAGAEVAL